MGRGKCGVSKGERKIDRERFRERERGAGCFSVQPRLCSPCKRGRMWESEEAVAIIGELVGLEGGAIIEHVLGISVHTELG